MTRIWSFKDQKSNILKGAKNPDVGADKAVFLETEKRPVWLECLVKKTVKQTSISNT